MKMSLLVDLVSKATPLQQQLVRWGLAGVAFRYLYVIVQSRWPRQKIVLQDDGTPIRYIYPTAASGWLPFLGHTLKVISPDGPKWIMQNFTSHKRPFYVDLAGKRIVQCSGPEFRKFFVRAPDAQLNAMEGNGALFNFKITFDSLDFLHRPFQATAIRTTFVTLRKQLIPRIMQGLEEALEGLFPQLRSDGDIATVTPLQKLIVDMIGSMLSTILVGETLGRKRDLVKAMKELTNEINHITFNCQTRPTFMIDTTSLGKLKAIMHEHIEPEVQARRAAKRQNPDFLQLLIDAQDENGDEFSANAVANRMLTIVFATFDTTASTLTNLLLDLASPSNAHSKRRVLTEVEAAISSSQNKPLSQEIVSQMTYSKACMYESLRRTESVVSAPLRMVKKEFSVPLGKGDDGIDEVAIVPEGALLSYSAILAHRDPANFKNPDAFDPDQNQMGKSAADISQNNIAFGLGRHSCPGRFFAGEEIQTALVLLFQNFDLSLEHDYEPKCLNGQPVISDIPVKVTLTKAGEAMLKRLRSQQKEKEV